MCDGSDVRPAPLLASILLAAAAGCVHPGTPPEGPAAAPSAAKARGCVDCHGEAVAAQRKRSAVHAPLRDDAACEGCHKAHDGKGPAPLAVGEPKLCNGCHGKRAFMRTHGGTRGPSRCTGCHAPHASAEAGLLREPPSKLCSGCHPDVSKAHGGYPVAETRCTSCHQLHGGDPKLVSPILHAPYPECRKCHPEPRAEKPFALSAPEPTLCFGCHPATEKALAALVVPHAPVKVGTCSACHAPHAAANAALLVADPKEVCGRCHAATVAATRRPGAHRPAADEKCTSCHAAHGGIRGKFLHKPQGAICTSCHPSVNVWVGRQSVHAPVRAGACSECHEPHGAEKRLLRATGIALCNGCHGAGRSAASAKSRVHPGEPKGDCLACHDAHASDRPRLVRRAEETLCKDCHASMIEARRAAGEEPHQPFVGGSCSACHTPHAGGKSGLKPGDLCTSCHVGTRPTWAKVKSSHRAFVSGGCTDCHDAHAAKGRSLLKGGAGELCARCHEKETAALQAPAGVGHSAIRGVNCIDCHRGHGSPLALLLRHEPDELCAECHAPGSVSAVAAHLAAGEKAARCTKCHAAHAPRAVSAQVP
jgi:predicted CXXCH cytochrome family protein